MKPLAIVDYGMGNLRSVQKGFERVGVPAEVTRDAARVREAPGVVLPGVGAFGACMANLDRYGLLEAVRRVVERGTPFLGICLGLQLLFEESDEFGPVAGLGVLRGRCVRFPSTGDLRVPHMGWNQLEVRRPCPLLAGVPESAFVYFVHSYYVVPEDPSVILSTTTYGEPFVSAIWRDNLFGCQYHPEKSQAVGLRILANFGAIVDGRAPAAG